MGKTLPVTWVKGCIFFHGLGRAKKKSPGQAGLLDPAVDIVVQATQA
jgi:hypothetical protein